jgi:hypothetical protein
MTMPLSLSDEQMDRLLAAAALLPVTSRDAFLKSVASRASSTSAPTASRAATKHLQNPTGVKPDEQS